MMRKHDGLLQRRICTDEKGETATKLETDVFYDALEKSTEYDHQLFKFSEIALYLRINPYIHTGYRGQLTIRKCFESVFWWTNETLNIWTHVFGWMLLFGVTIRDLYAVWGMVPIEHLVISLITAFCFQVCLILSALYHTLLCRSEEAQQFFLTLDLFGLATSTLLGFLITIYFGFICQKGWRNFYMRMGIILYIMNVLFFYRLGLTPTRKLICFIIWFVCAVAITVHWYLSLGGFQNTIIQNAMPIIILLYATGTIAVFVYILKIPERFLPGRCDYVGSSHQWWHLLVVASLYISHVNAKDFLKVILNHRCPNSL